MKFFPFVFSLFLFVLFANLIGLIPYTFTVTSQIIVTFAFAALVIGLVIAYGFFRNGTHFLGLFVPSGVSPILLPFIVLIEVISFMSRPISLSVRLFANMLAGHITLKVLGGFVAALLGAGVYAIIAPLPLAAIVAAHRLRAAGGCAAGLCLRHSHLRLSERRNSSGPLKKYQQQIGRPLPQA